MAVVENAGINGAPSNRTDSHAPTDADQSKSNHSNGNPISRSNDQSFHVIVHQQPPMTTTAQANGTVNHNGGYVVQDNHQMVRNGVDEEREMRDLEEMLSKLNPMAEEFVPPSLASHRLVPLSPSHFGYTNGFDSFVIQNNPGIANGNIARRVCITNPPFLFQFLNLKIKEKSCHWIVSIVLCHMIVVSSIIYAWKSLGG